MVKKCPPFFCSELLVHPSFFISSGKSSIWNFKTALEKKTDVRNNKGKGLTAEDTMEPNVPNHCREWMGWVWKFLPWCTSSHKLFIYWLRRSLMARYFAFSVHEVSGRVFSPRKGVTQLLCAKRLNTLMHLQSYGISRAASPIRLKMLKFCSFWFLDIIHWGFFQVLFTSYFNAVQLVSFLWRLQKGLIEQITYVCFSCSKNIFTL